MKRAPKHDWPVVAEALAARIPKGALHPRVIAWTEARRRSRAMWTIAFSGGADSLVLLLLMWALWPERRKRLLALHFDHRLRGRASTADAAFCARVAQSLGVRFLVGRWERARGASTGEAAARKARFDFFATQMGGVGRGTLWLGHQQDDVAETLLMRLGRGSGTAGLSAPRPVQTLTGTRVHLRPLLGIRRSALISHLASVGVAAGWREDASNAAGDHFRNRVRLRVLPAWARAAGRDVVAGAALSRELLEEDDTALESWLEGLGVFSRKGCLDVQALSAAPRAVTRRALHRWLLTCGPEAGDLSRQGFTILLEALERGAPTRFSLGRSGFAVIKAGFLSFEPKAPRHSYPHRSLS